MIYMNIACHLHLKTGPILFIDINFMDEDISVVHFNRNNTKQEFSIHVMSINLHNKFWQLICILTIFAYHLSLKTDPILFTDVHFIDKDISVVLLTEIIKRNGISTLMAINLHIWPLICILMNIAYHLSLKTDPILFTDVHFIDKDISVVQFVRLVTD